MDDLNVVRSCNFMSCHVRRDRNVSEQHGPVMISNGWGVFDFDVRGQEVNFY